MNLTKSRNMHTGNLGLLLLAIWLIVTGLLPLVNINVPGAGMILALLAVAAGILLVLPLSRAKPSASTGTFLLSIWLIVQGAMVLLRISFPQSNLVMAILAIAAGALLLLQR